MNRLATGLAIGLLALVAILPSVARGQTLLLDYVGYDYEDPDLDGGQFGELGSGYVGLGFVPGLYAPLVADPVQYEYTYHISGLTSLGSMWVGPFLIIAYSPGTLSVYEDAKVGGTPGDYGTNPPNATAPPTFVDGTLFLAGTLTNFQYVLNTLDGTGSYEAALTITGGKEVDNGHVPENQRSGWTFAGTTANELNMPEGYDHQVDGQVFLNPPVPTQPSTWGRIKAQYR